ncbi:MAG: NAD(P)H-hydrate epimerase [Planctomycetales bacterium]
MPLTCAQAREIDVRAVRDYGIPSLLLMENAGRNAAELLLQLGIRGPVVICAGKGNNGGDGFVIARHLRNKGIDVRLFLFASPSELRGDAAVNYQILHAAGWTGTVLTHFPHALTELSSQFATADWIVDALLGTGASGVLREPFAAVVSTMNESGKKILAVDLPTGLDADTGQPGPVCVRATHTATFVAPKIGFSNPAAQPFLGQLHVLDIGIPAVMLDPTFVPHSNSSSRA